MSTLLPYPKFKAVDAAGLPISGGKVYTYRAGTSTAKAAYTDRAATTPHANPVVLDSLGEASLYLLGKYKLILKDAADAQIWSMDGVQGMGDWESAVEYADYSEADQGAAGSGSSIKDLIDALGATNAVIHLANNSGSATTTYTVSTDLSIPDNIDLRIERGARLSVASGKTVTFGSGGIRAGEYQIFAGSGSIAFAAGSRLNSRWFADLATAIAKIGSVACQLDIKGTNTLSANLTFPATLCLSVARGNGITQDGAYTVAINGGMWAGVYQVFFGFAAGEVTFARRSVPCVYPEWWGAAGAPTDDILASQCAHASLPATGGKLLYLGDSYYHSGAVVISKPVEICGPGMDATKIYSTSETADLFTIACDGAVHVHDIGLAATLARSAGAAISVAGASGSTINSHSRFERIYFGSGGDYYKKHLDFTASGYWTVSRCVFTGAQTAAIAIKNTVNTDTGDNVIEKNTFSYGTISGNVAAIYHESGGGLRIEGNKILGFNYAYWLNLTASSGGLQIIGNSLAGQGGPCLYFTQSVEDQVYQAINIGDNEFDGGSRALEVAAGNAVWLLNFTIGGNVVYALDSGATGILLNGASAGTVGPNQMSIPATGTGINVGAQSTNLSLDENNIIGAQTPIICASPTTHIRHTGAGGMTFAQLPADSADGSMIYVNDGTNSNPLAGSSNGIMALKLGGTWYAACKNY